MKLTYCDKCGYYKEVEAILFDRCPNCNTPLIIDDIEADENIARELDKNGIIISKPFDFKDNLISLRKEQNWESIETKLFKLDHAKFKSMGKITDDEVVDFLIDLWKE